MAQTGYTPILIYSSSTVSQAPAVGNLTNSTLGSELAINITDGKLFYKDNANAIQVIAWKVTPTTAGGTGLTTYTAGDLLYYASGTTLTKLAIGTAYQALQVNAGGTAPSWQPSATSVLTAQGDLLYASAANTLARLAKNTTATRYLANTGSSNNPQWDQVNLANGVTGTLPVGNGGTGTATAFTAGSVVFAGASGVFSQSNAQFFWDNTNNRLGIGTTGPSYPLQITRSGVAAYLANTDGTGTVLSGVNGSGVGVYGTFSNTDVAFFTNSAERGRFDTGGNLLLNTTSQLNSYNVPGSIHSLTTDAKQLNLRNSNATAGRVWTLGMTSASEFIVYANASTGVYLTWNATSWTSSSDERFKTDLKPIDNATSKVMSLRAVTGRFKTDDEKVSRAFLIAQDVQAVFPEAVNVREDEDKTLGLQYTDIIPLLVASIKEQQAIIDSLKARIDAAGI